MLFAAHAYHKICTSDDKESFLTPLLYHLGRFCSRHSLVVLAIWIVVAISVVIGAKTVGQETNDNVKLPGTDSQASTNLLKDKFPAQANGTVPIAFRAPEGKKLTDAKYKKPIQRVVKAYSKDPAITKAVGPFSDQASDQLNKKKTIGYISLNLKDSSSQLHVEGAHRIIDVADPLDKVGLKPAAGGYLGQKVSKPSTHVSEVVGLGAAVVILLFTFGTAIAMGIPILTAILGLSIGLGIIAFISHSAQVPTSAPTLATMIGLGVGIDYALFIVTRHRSQLDAGMEPHESVARATATSGGAVVFAAGTVIIALLSLAAAGIPVVTTLGYTASVVVLVAATAATTLLPSILGLIGTGINRLRVPGMRTQHDDRPHGWARWAAFVGSHPWPALVLGFIVLIVLAVPVRYLHLGQTDNGALPKTTQSRQSYDTMTEGFGSGANGPMLVAVSLSKPAHNDQADLDKLRNQEQKSTQQEISKQQAKADKEIQQQTEQAKQEAKQKIDAEADQKKQEAKQQIEAAAKQQQQKAEQQIEAQADQAKQQVGPDGQEAIDDLAQQEIDQQNQNIQKQADQEINKQNQSIDQQANQELQKQDKSIQNQADQKQAQENKSIAKQVKQQAAKKEKSSGDDDKEKFLESKASDPRLTDLRNDVKKTKGVDKVTYPLVNKKGTAAVYTVTPTTAPSSRATVALVNELRDDVLPKATKGKHMEADVGGTTASYIDLASEITRKLPLVIGIVLVLSFLLLLVAFRSVLVPLKAVTMNVFSILASFGVVTYAFNHEWTARLIGLEGPIPIVSYVPLMMFAILFGLSMDYEVFLMTHVREQYKETGDPHEAVVHGLASTARVITSAAMIMVSVFLAFVINGDPTVKQFGLGMAVAVAVDATVVRCVLVPAIMALLGSAGWWFPNWLERVTPKFSIEGDEWFAEQDSTSAAETESPQTDKPQEEVVQSEALQSEPPQVAPRENPDTHNEPTRTD
jgi:uncharacterized membrane protein YdfJ with MMPL/SSD domain